MQIMKKNIFKLLFVGFAVVSFTSCEDYFDTVPSNVVDLETVFSNRGLALQWLTNVYSYIPDNTDQNYYNGADCTEGVWTSASNEGYLPWSQCEGNNIILGTLYPSTGYVRNQWTAYYRGIQKANGYLAKIDECKPMPENEKAWTKAEVRALRAYFYFNLVRQFGPVPLIGDRVYNIDDPLEDMTLPRASVDSCFEYIISELQAVINSGNLISQFNGAGAFDDQFAGNLTQEAAEGILSVVYLYRASYVFNGDSYYQGMKNVDGSSLFPQSADPKKWEDARDAAKKIIDSGKYALVLRDITGKRVTDIKESDPYNSCFYSAIGRSDNEEMIFFRTGPNNNIYYQMRPKHSGIQNAQSGGGALSVPLQFVDLFFTKDGLRIEDDPNYYTYDTSNPTAENIRKMTGNASYKDQHSGYTYFTPGSSNRVMKQFYNREPRFYTSITFQNRRWDFDQSKAYYTDMSQNGNSGPAKNGHDHPIFGVIARKLYVGDIKAPYSVKLRLSEIYLNYAEACNELGDVATALHYVNLIRSRAGIPEYKGLAPEDQTALDARGSARIELESYDKDFIRKVIYRERTIELAFECKHYFDVRRWGVADMAQGDGWIYPAYHKGGEGGDMLGFNVNNAGTAQEQNSQLNFYKRLKVQHRIYTKRMTFFPIPQEEINRNRQLVQNAGWNVE